MSNSDRPRVTITGDSPEAVAFALLEMVAFCEDKSLTDHMRDKADREWILSTYRACLAATGIKGSD